MTRRYRTGEERPAGHDRYLRRVREAEDKESKMGKKNNKRSKKTSTQLDVVADNNPEDDKKTNIMFMDAATFGCNSTRIVHFARSAGMKMSELRALRAGRKDPTNDQRTKIIQVAKESGWTPPSQTADK